MIFRYMLITELLLLNHRIVRYDHNEILIILKLDLVKNSFDTAAIVQITLLQWNLFIILISIEYH